MSFLRKNVASQHIGFALNSTAAGAPVTAGGAGTVVIDGGSQAACAGTFTHKGTGQWDYAPTQAETNGTSISFTFTGTGAIQVGMQFFTGNYDPTAATVATLLTGDAYARLGAPAGASTAADIAAVKSDSGAIKTQTDKLAFTVTNQVDANVLDWKSATAPAMTGDAYARLGAPAGASTAADIAAVKTDLDAGVNVVKWLGVAVTADSAGLPKVTVGSGLKTNTAASGFTFTMTDSTTHNPKTGVTVTSTRSINGGAFASTTNSVTELSNGDYTLNLSAADMNGLFIMLRFTGTSADDLNILLVTTP